MRTVDKSFFPGWVRKSITFTIDDGNIVTDQKMMDMIKPAGIRGTFNLCTPLKKMSSAEYAEFYRGYEIANHCNYHLYPMTERIARTTKEIPFDKETADPAYAYPAEMPGVYYVAVPTGWRRVAWSTETYMDNVDACQRELEEIFGKGSVQDYVWPYGMQKNEDVFGRLKAYGFRSIRTTGNVRESTGFALPADRTRWSYNADHHDLCEVATLYDVYPDDGELKFFSFGVHSVDFENTDRWGELKAFCDRMGNRPKDFWYATVGEIFDYEDAVKALTVTDDSISNQSELTVYLKIDGKPITVEPFTTLQI